MEVAIGKFSKIITLDFIQTKFVLRVCILSTHIPVTFAKLASPSPSSFMHAEHIGYNVNKIR